MKNKKIFKMDLFKSNLLYSLITKLFLAQGQKYGAPREKKLINIGLRGAQNCFVVNTEEAEYF